MTRLCIYIFLLIMAVSCIKEEAWENGSCSDVVEIGMRMEIVGEDIQTRAVVDPAISESTQVQDVIKNFWVLQYDGTSDDAKLVGEPRYYPDMSEFLAPVGGGGHGGHVKLVRSSGDNRVVILANTFDPLMTFPKDEDFADLKKRCKEVTGPESFLASSGNDRYVMFNGSTVVKVNDGVTVSCLLMRNVAKVSVRLINSSSDVTINSWQIKNIPSVSYFYTDYELPSEFPSLNDCRLIDYSVVTPDDPIVPKADPAAQYAETSFTFYIPVNKRGTDERVTGQSLKNSYAPTGATYLQVNASYAGGSPIQYTFYLGENLTTDFNLHPNHAYEYEFDISARGDADADSRVKELGLVDFTESELANCYMINPAQTEGVRRTFMIPVARVDEFWGNKGYENVPNYTLGASKPWRVEIIACNFDNSEEKVKFTKSTGAGSNDYFEFTVAPGTVGNAIVALYANDDQACWSWHLWITDYAPEEAYSKAPEAGVYSYSVTGGVVHRYEGTIWQEGGEYEKRFIMDRNLGAWGANYPEKGNGTGTMYFQYGRKDPIFGNASTGFEKFSTYPYNDIIKDSSDPVASLLFAVNNPLTYITGSWGAWTIGNKYNPSTVDKGIVWMDPYTSSKNTDSPKTKSIFDPCPAGYVVPESGTWNDFRRQDASRPTTNINVSGSMFRNFPAFTSSNRGCYYWPYSEKDGAAVDAPSEPVYYPATGIKQPSGSVSGHTSTIYSMTSTIENSTHMRSMTITATTLNLNRDDITINLAAPVRCVTERDVQ